MVQRISGHVEHRHTYLYSVGHQSKIFGNYLPLVLCRPIDDGQVPTPCACTSSSTSHIHRNCYLLWCIHFIVSSIPERSTLGSPNHSRWTRVLSLYCCVANILPSQNNFWIIDYHSIVGIIYVPCIRRANLSSILFLSRYEATLHDARTLCSAL